MQGGGQADANLGCPSAVEEQETDRLRFRVSPIPCLEKAHNLKPNDRRPEGELLGCYLATQQFRKAAALFPTAFVLAAGLFTFVYLVGLGLLLPFSIGVRERPFPGLRFSAAWVLLFFEGQVAFLLALAVLPVLKNLGEVFGAVIISGLPIVAVAVTGFAGQPWGEPFRWPPRFGGAKTIVIAGVSLVGLYAINGAFLALYVQLTHKPAPIQNTVPIIREALRINPIVAWAAVPLLIPMIEEILFRGLLFGAFLKHWGVKAAIVATAFLFACVHLQIVGFFYLFCLGLILGWARSRSRSLALPIVIHSFNNTLAMLALIFSARM